MNVLIQHSSFILLIILGLALAPALPADPSEATKAQVQYAIDLRRSVPGIQNAWWSQDISLWVEIDIEVFSSNPKLYAQQIADKLSIATARKFGRFVCVRVYHGNQRVLAKSCSGP